MFYVTGCRDEGMQFTGRVIFYNRTSNVLVRSNASLAFSGFFVGSAFICVGLDLRVLSWKFGLAIEKIARFTWTLIKICIGVFFRIVFFKFCKSRFIIVLSKNTATATIKHLRVDENKVHPHEFKCLQIIPLK